MSEQTHSDEIDARTGRKSFEGEHNVSILSKGMPWDAKILVDGKPIDRNTQRVEIDLDCEKAQAIVQITRIDGKTIERTKQELLANLLDLTLDECLVVDKILEQARKEASSNSLATQLFAINESEEDGAVTTHILSALIQDAKRYRAFKADSIEHSYVDLDSSDWYDEAGPDVGFDKMIDAYVEQQRAKLRAAQEKQS